MRGVATADYYKISDSTPWVNGGSFKLDNNFFVPANLKVPDSLEVNILSSEENKIPLYLQIIWKNSVSNWNEIQILKPDGSQHCLLQKESGGEIFFNPYIIKKHPAFTEGGVYTLRVRAVDYKDANENNPVVLDYTEWVSLPFEIKKAKIKVAAPAGTYKDSVQVNLSCEPTGASIKYVLNGSKPNTSYTAPFWLKSGETTVRACALVYGQLPSDTLKVRYTIASEVEKLPIPIIEAAVFEFMTAQTVGIRCPQPGVQIYYRTDASTEFALYTGSFEVEQSCRVEAFAVMEGLKSDTARVDFTKLTAFPSSVSISPDRANPVDSVWVSIDCAEPDCVIYYNTSQRSQFRLYNGPFCLRESSVVRAYATKPGMACSDTATMRYQLKYKVPAPVISPQNGLIKDSLVEVNISCARFGAKIYFRVDSTAAFKEFDSLVLRESATVEAFATKNHMLNSDTVKMVYTLNAESGEEPEPTTPDTVAEPVFVGWSAEVYQDSALVELHCDTAEAAIFYRIAKVDTFALYTTAFYIYDTTTIYAFATKENLVNSDTVKKIYYVAKTVITDTGNNHEPEPVVPDTVAGPVFVGWSAEVYQDSALVELHCDTAEAAIFYRIAKVDTFALYTTAFYIYDTTTIYAFATKENLVNSDTVFAVYNVAKTPVEDTIGPSVRNEENILTGVKLYPNPSNGTIHLALPCKANVDVFTLTGTTVLKENGVVGLRTYTLLHSGLYLVRVSAGEKMTVKKVTIK